MRPMFKGVSDTDIAIASEHEWLAPWNDAVLIRSNINFRPVDTVIHDDTSAVRVTFNDRA
jgi:hypothetical protein